MGASFVNHGDGTATFTITITGPLAKVRDILGYAAEWALENRFRSLYPKYVFANLTTQQKADLLYAYVTKDIRHRAAMWNEHLQVSEAQATAASEESTKFISE